MKKLLLLLLLIPSIALAAPPSKPNTLANGTLADADEVSENEDALYNYLQAGVDTYADGTIVNADINAAANIAVTKIAGTAVTTATTQTITGDKTISGDVTLSGGVTLPASGVVIGTANQGDIFYDDGTDLARLTPGTSGYILQSQGAAANPTWASVPHSALVYAWSGNESYAANDYGIYTGTAGLTPDIDSVTVEYLFFGNDTITYRTFLNFKFKKVASINTVTINARLWANTADGDKEAVLNVDIGGANNTVKSVTSSSPSWVTTSDIDVSGLTNGTVYNGVVQLKAETAGESAYCSAVTLIGS